MTTHAYNPIYLNKASSAIGIMVHDAVHEFGCVASEFLYRFASSQAAAEIEVGNPRYLMGRSGLELYLEVEEQTRGRQIITPAVECSLKSKEYRAGWLLAQYQWYSGRTFRSILEMISYEELAELSPALPSADLKNIFDKLDAKFDKEESRLKRIRRSCGLTQEELSELSTVPLSTIRAYERKAKDIKKAQADILLRLCSVLKCNMQDLLA